METSAASPPLVAGRQCGSCAMCCKLPEIKALNKPRDVWCEHCSTRQKCDIYETRPTPCRDFYCGYMQHAAFGEEWHPSKSRMMLRIDAHQPHLFVLVDPSRPDAWRKEPYYSQLKMVARNNQAQGLYVLITIGDRNLVVLPDSEVDVGTVAHDETLQFTVTQTPSGPITSVTKQKI